MARVDRCARCGIPYVTRGFTSWCDGCWQTVVAPPTHRTSVAESTDPMTLRRWAFEWCRTVGVIACVGIQAVWNWVKR